MIITVYLIALFFADYLAAMTHKKYPLKPLELALYKAVVQFLILMLGFAHLPRVSSLQLALFGPIGLLIIELAVNKLNSATKFKIGEELTLLNNILNIGVIYFIIELVKLRLIV